MSEITNEMVAAYKSAFKSVLDKWLNDEITIASGEIGSAATKHALSVVFAAKDAEIAQLREALTEAQKEITGKPLATGEGHEHDLWLRGLMRTALRESSL